MVARIVLTATAKRSTLGARDRDVGDDEMVGAA